MPPGRSYAEAPGEKLQLEHDIAAAFGNCYNYRNSENVGPPPNDGSSSPSHARAYRKLTRFFFADDRGNVRDLDELPHATNRLYAYGQLVRPSAAESMVRANTHAPERLHVRLLVRRWSVSRARAAAADADAAAGWQQQPPQSLRERHFCDGGSNADDLGAVYDASDARRGEQEHGRASDTNETSETAENRRLTSASEAENGGHGSASDAGDDEIGLWVETVPGRASRAAAGGGVGFAQPQPGWWYRLMEPAHHQYQERFRRTRQKAEHMLAAAHGHWDASSAAAAVAGGGRQWCGSGDGGDDGLDADTCSCDAARGSAGSDPEENGSEADAESMGGDSLSLASVDSRSESGGGGGDGDGTDVEVNSTTSAASFTSVSSCGTCGRAGRGGGGSSSGHRSGSRGEKGENSGGGGSSSNGKAAAAGEAGAAAAGAGGAEGGGSGRRDGRRHPPEPDDRTLQAIAEMRTFATEDGAGVPLARTEEFVRRFLRRDMHVAARAAAVEALNGSGAATMAHLVQCGAFLVLHAWLRDAWARLRVHKQPRRGVPDWNAVGGLPYLERTLWLMSRLPLTMALLRSTEVGRLVKKLRRLGERHKTEGLLAAARRLYAHLRDIVAASMKRQGFYGFDYDSGSSRGERCVRDRRGGGGGGGYRRSGGGVGNGSGNGLDGGFGSYSFDDSFDGGSHHSQDEDGGLDVHGHSGSHHDSSGAWRGGSNSGSDTTQRQQQQLAAQRGLGGREVRWRWSHSSSGGVVGMYGDSDQESASSFPRGVPGGGRNDGGSRSPSPAASEEWARRPPTPRCPTPYAQSPDLPGGGLGGGGGDAMRFGWPPRYPAPEQISGSGEMLPAAAAAAAAAAADSNSSGGGGGGTGRYSARGQRQGSLGAYPVRFSSFSGQHSALLPTISTFEESTRKVSWADLRGQRLAEVHVIEPTYRREDFVPGHAGLGLALGVVAEMGRRDLSKKEKKLLRGDEGDDDEAAEDSDSGGSSVSEPGSVQGGRSRAPRSASGGSSGRGGLELDPDLEESGVMSDHSADSESSSLGDALALPPPLDEARLRSAARAAAAAASSAPDGGDDVSDGAGSGDGWSGGRSRRTASVVRRRGRSPLAGILRHSKRQRRLPDGSSSAGGGGGGSSGGGPVGASSGGCSGGGGSAEEPEQEPEVAEEPEQMDDVEGSSARRVVARRPPSPLPTEVMDEDWAPGSPADPFTESPPREPTENDVSRPAWELPPPTTLLGPPTGTLGLADESVPNETDGESNDVSSPRIEKRFRTRRRGSSSGESSSGNENPGNGPSAGSPGGGGGSDGQAGSSSGGKHSSSVGFHGTPPRKRRKALAQDDERDVGGGQRNSDDGLQMANDSAHFEARQHNQHDGGASSGGSGTGDQSGGGGSSGGMVVHDDAQTGGRTGEEGLREPGLLAAHLSAPRRANLVGWGSQYDDGHVAAAGGAAAAGSGAGKGRMTSEGISALSESGVAGGGSSGDAQGRSSGVYACDDEQDREVPRAFSTSSLDSRSSAATHGGDTSYSDLSSDDFDSMSARSDGSLRPPPHSQAMGPPAALSRTPTYEEDGNSSARADLANGSGGGSSGGGGGGGSTSGESKAPNGTDNTLRGSSLNGGGGASMTAATAAAAATARGVADGGSESRRGGYAGQQKPAD